MAEELKKGKLGKSVGLIDWKALREGLKNLCFDEETIEKIVLCVWENTAF